MCVKSKSLSESKFICIIRGGSGREPLDSNARVEVGGQTTTSLEVWSSVKYLSISKHNILTYPINAKVALESQIIAEINQRNAIFLLEEIKTNRLDRIAPFFKMKLAQSRVLLYPGIKRFKFVTERRRF